MRIELSQQQQEWVAQQLAKQRFRDEKEVIGVALGLLEHRQQQAMEQRARLKAAIGEGMAEADAGEFAVEDDIDTILAEIRAEDTL